MTCPSCAAEVPEGSRFCPQCGTLLVQTEERRIVTVLFADLVGFTGLAESRDPEGLKLLVDRCFQRLVADITAFGGTVDKIIGDAIVALFGAPTAHEDDPERAVRAALRMQRSLATFTDADGAALQMRIGINTGEVLVGALRAGGDYTAMGDTVNIAARLQTAAVPGEVLVGPETYAATDDVVEYESRGQLPLRGRDGEVSVYSAQFELVPPGHRARSSRAPLVGRDPEIDVVSSAVASAVSRSRLHLVTVIGEAGMGKNRLVEETWRAAQRDHGAVVFDGRVQPYGEPNPLGAVGNAIATAAGVGGGDSAEDVTQRLEAFLTEVTGQDADETPHEEFTPMCDALLAVMGRSSALDDLDAGRRTLAMRDGVRQFLAGICEHRPVLLVLADLQWADDRLVDMIDHLAEVLAARPFVLVVTAREGADHHRWGSGPGRHNTTTIHLDALDRDASGELLRHLLGSGLSSSTVDELHSRTGGNPFFLEEIATLMREQAGDGAVVASALPGAAELPDTLRGLVAARLDALSTDEHTMVDNAAVIGRFGSVYGLLKLTGGEEELGRSTFRRLVDTDILTIDGEGWRFRSDLVRDIAYSMLTKSRRAERHLAIANWMAQSSDDLAGRDLLVTAHHYAAAAELLADVADPSIEDWGTADGRAGLIGNAIDWLERAGVQSDAADSHYVAARFFHRALDLLEPDDPRRFTSALGRARARLGLRELPAAALDAQDAVDLAAASGHRHDEALARRTLGEVETAAGDHGRARSSLEAALDVFESLDDQVEVAETLRLRGLVGLFEGDHAAAEHDLDAARQLFAELGDDAGVAWCLQNLAWLSFELGHLDEARSRLDVAVELFEAEGDAGGLNFARGLMAFVHFYEGRAAQAEELAVVVLEDARQRGERFGEAMMELLLASMQLWDGRAVAAADRAAEARVVFEQIDNDFGVVQALGLLGRAQAALGLVDESRTTLDECLARALEAPGRPQETFARLVSAGGAVQAGEPDRALDHLDHIGDRLRGRRMVGSVDAGVTRVLALVQLGRIDEADSELAGVIDDGGPSTALDSTHALAAAAAGHGHDALQLSRKVLGDTRSTYLDRRTALLASALVHARSGDRDAAVAVFDDAAELMDATESVMSQALVRLARAIGFEALGDPDAVDLRAEAESGFAVFGVWPIGWERAFRIAAGSLPPVS